MSKSYALFGWSPKTIESAQKLGKPFVVVSLPEFETLAIENNLQFVAWDFKTWNEQLNSLELIERLKQYNVKFAIPLYEETVEWAGAVNSILMNDPRILNRSFLFRNKAIMKRRALISGLRVGAFEEAYRKEDVFTFMKRLNDANLQLAGEEDSWVHIKPFSSMGTVGHLLIKSKKEIEDKVNESIFPCLLESHLPGDEFSCEVFVHNGEIMFINITEYVKLGYSNFIPASAELMAKKDIIYKANEQLVKAFGFKNGMLHPEWFLTKDLTMNFGEVAARIPGGHIFELMEKAFGFDAHKALILCSDTDTTKEELKEVFKPAYEKENYLHAGCLMIYPKAGKIESLHIPEELKEDPYFEEHTLHPPLGPHKVPENREGFGNHFGAIYFKGEDASRMKKLLKYYEGVDFYS